ALDARSTAERRAPADVAERDVVLRGARLEETRAADLRGLAAARDGPRGAGRRAVAEVRIADRPGAAEGPGAAVLSARATERAPEILTPTALTVGSFQARLSERRGGLSASDETERSNQQT